MIRPYVLALLRKWTEEILYVVFRIRRFSSSLMLDLRHGLSQSFLPLLRDDTLLILLGKPLRDVVAHQEQSDNEQNRGRDLPEIGVGIVVHAVEPDEIHPEVACQKGKWQEEDGYDGQLLHALVLVGGDCVED